jgi:hypothetical protein
MFSSNRIRIFLITLWISMGSTPSVHAQHFHPHADCGYPLTSPIYSHGHLHGGFMQIVIEPAFPIGVVAPPGFGMMIPNRVSAPHGPFAAAPAVGVENFARAEIAARGAGVRGAVDLGLRETGPFDELQEVRRRVSVLKRSTPASRVRADRLISNADASFAKQSYARAVALYRDAIARAPDYAEAHFRLAHAYVATRRYNLALKSAMMALELSGTARRDGFSLEEMYRGNKFARERHDEMLSEAALREPNDGGLQFLIGFTVHYAPNPLMARGHFRTAMRFPGAHQAYVRQFLPVVPVADPAELAIDAN